MAYKGKKILAVIPARGGSKGIPKKNLKKNNGITLIGHAAIICSELDYLDGSIISTDDIEMREEGIKCGLDAPFLRPRRLSSDNANASDMWKHAIIEAEKFYGFSFDLSICLEPTSPMRRSKHINLSLKKYLSGNYDSLMTLSQTDSKQHPDKQIVIKDDEITFFTKQGKSIINRQELVPVYHRNGVVYISNCQFLLNNNLITDGCCGANVIEDQIINIDNYLDLELARYYMSRN